MIWMHSYTYRSYPVERALKKAEAYGYSGLELSTVHVDAKNVEADLARIVGLSKKYGVPIAVLDHGADLATADTAAHAQAVESWKTAIRRAATLGARFVNGSVGSFYGPDPNNFSANGSKLATDEHYYRAAEGLNQISKVAEQEGVTVALEIHMNTIHDSAASTLRLLRDVRSRYVVSNIDPGNMHATGHAESAPQAVQLLGERLQFVHLKNCRIRNGAWDYSWLLDAGDIDMFSVIHAMKNNGYTGPFCIEYCGLGDPDVAAERDIQYLRKILAEVQA